MDQFFSTLKPFFDYLLSIGNIVLLPIIIFALATLWFKQKPIEAFHSALLIGIGYVGISMVTSFLTANLGPAVQAMVNRFNLSFNVIDVGTAGSKFVAFGTPVGLAYIPIVILVNLLLITLKLTKTIDIDIWNYWHFAFWGGLVYGVTNNFLYGALAVAISAALMLFFADLTQPIVEKFYKLPSISIPHGTSLSFGILAWPFAKLIEAIPGLRDIDVTSESIQKRFGPFGEPAVMGLIMGIILGALGGQTLPQVLQLGMKMAGVFFLISRVVGILVKGLVPIAEAAKETFTEKYKGREIFIGLDSALLIGHPAVMATALLMMPISILLAAVLPGNRFLPFSDLVLYPFVFAMVVPICKGNIVRSVIVGTCVMAIGLYVATFVSDAFTTAGLMGGLTGLQPGQLASSVVDGATWVGAALKFLFGLLPH